MSGPTFVNFSPVAGTVLATIERIAEDVCHPWECAPTQFGYLSRSNDPYDGGYALDGELEDCSAEDIKTLAAGTRSFAVLYVSHQARANFGVHFTEIGEEGHVVTIEADRSMIYHRDDDYTDAGRWFEGFLISLAIAVGADVCAAGDTVVVQDRNMSLEKVTELMKRPRYIALDPATTLERLRNGDMLALPGPVFHAFAVKLLDPSEIKFLLKKPIVARGLEYKQAPGYDVFSNIAIP